MKKNLFTAVLLCMACGGFAQQPMGVTHAGRSTGQPPFPLNEYVELANPVATDETSWKGCGKVSVQWGSRYVRYPQEVNPRLSGRTALQLKGWKGERVAAQLLIATPTALENVSVEMTEPRRASGDKIAATHILKGFVRYVMTDELNKDKQGTCGHRPDATQFDSTLVADPIDHLAASLPMAAKTSRGYWIRVWIPEEAQAGDYRSEVTVRSGAEVIGKLKLDIRVQNRVLPAPSHWGFHLDLWQNPFAVARYYGVEPWSPEHFDTLRTEMKPYADAGGKVITVSSIHRPWNAQTYDPFETMITWMKRADGTWLTDYTVFDRWVEFMQQLGVTREVGCYSMIPWKLSFRYFDQATNSLKDLQARPGDAAYREFWLPKLKDFAAHLKAKGWFGITHIAMDERPMKDMLEVLKIIREADPDFKVSLAGSLHDELSDELNDYCIPIGTKYPEAMKQKRKEEGKITTYYTCCSESYPNTYTFSNPAEAEWLGWYAAKENLDGYLRWALNSWTIEPLLDSRFYTWGAGDTYLLYPGGRTSLRFENLVAGIQAYEKVMILKKEWEQAGNKAALKRLQKVLDSFDERTLEKVSATGVVEKANRELFY